MTKRENRERKIQHLREAIDDYEILADADAGNGYFPPGYLANCEDACRSKIRRLQEEIVYGF